MATGLRSMASAMPEPLPSKITTFPSVKVQQQQQPAAAQAQMPAAAEEKLAMSGTYGSMVPARPAPQLAPQTAQPAPPVAPQPPVMREPAATHEPPTFTLNVAAGRAATVGAAPAPGSAAVRPARAGRAPAGPGARSAARAERCVRR